MVIGWSVADALFWDHKSAIGSLVKMGDRTFEVVGILDKRKNAFLGENDEDNAFLTLPRTCVNDRVHRTDNWAPVMG